MRRLKNSSFPKLVTPQILILISRNNVLKLIPFIRTPVGPCVVCVRIGTSPLVLVALLSFRVSSFPSSFIYLVYVFICSYFIDI